MLSISSQLQSPRLTAEVGHLRTSGPLEPEYVFFLEDLGGLIVTRAACMSIFLIFSEHRSAGPQVGNPKTVQAGWAALCLFGIQLSWTHSLHFIVQLVLIQTTLSSGANVAYLLWLKPLPSLPGGSGPGWIKGSTRAGRVRMRQGPPQTVSTDARWELLSGSRPVFSLCSSEKCPYVFLTYL